jgi:endonuclease/exonuclease/phosphatase (EEP) superfamily protein YafD
MPKLRQFLPGRPPVWLVLVTIPYLLALSLITLFTALGPEHWWFACFNLYMPQWIWGLPAAALLLLCLVFARKWVGLPLVLLAWVAGPMMGFCWGIAQSVPPNAPRLRVMTYNVKWGTRNAALLTEEIDRLKPDLILMQDSMGVLGTGLGAELAGWNIRESGQYIIASRLPIDELESIDISSPGTHHHAVRTHLMLAGIPVTICTVHLLSPRFGLVSLRHWDTKGIEDSAAVRLVEIQRLVESLQKEPGPLVLTGDLNSPDQTIVCRMLHQIGLQDAFSHAGRGYGYTYGRFTRAEHSYVRIDHILVSPQWGISQCFVGTAEASDHCPVIADIFLTPTGKSAEGK